MVFIYSVVRFLSNNLVFIPLLLIACYPKTFYPLLRVCDVIKGCPLNCILLFPGRSEVFQEVTLTALTTESWKSFIDEETQKRILTEYSQL